MALTEKIDNYSGFADGIDGWQLGFEMQRQAERFGAKTEYAEVISTSLSGDIKKIITTSGEILARAVIIAMGANPRELGIEGEDALVGKGLHYCAHCDGRFYKGKTALVVGGGNSAVSDALYLSHLAEKVIVVHRRDSLRAARIYHEPLMRAENVEIIWDSALREYITENGRVCGAKVENLKTGELRDVPCNGVFVSIGRKPATEVFSGALELDENGYIVADESTRTNIEGVFAAGDIRAKELRQVVTAVSDGATAAHFAEKYLALR